MSQIQLKKLIKESRVGDLYIEIGEKIEEIETMFSDLSKLLKIDGNRTIAYQKQMKVNLDKIKKLLSDSFDFE